MHVSLALGKIKSIFGLQHVSKINNFAQWLSWKPSLFLSFAFRKQSPCGPWCTVSAATPWLSGGLPSGLGGEWSHTVDGGRPWKTLPVGPCSGAGSQGLGALCPGICVAVWFPGHALLSLFWHPGPAHGPAEPSKFAQGSGAPQRLARAWESVG